MGEERDGGTGAAEIIVERRWARTDVVLAGEVDVRFEEELAQMVRICGMADRPITVDARRLTFIDSTAVTALAPLADHGVGRPVLLGAPPTLILLLKLSGFLDLFELRE